MTQAPDDPNDPADRGSSGDEHGAGRKLDEDAAWRAIVENYGDRAEVGNDPSGPDLPSEADAGSAAGSAGFTAGSAGTPQSQQERLRGLFRPSWNDPIEPEATWDDEGHFVPPTPPPPPQPEPRRRMAWFGLFGAPTLMLAAVVLGWTLPSFISAILVSAFVGGFVYLVATMPQRRPGEGPGGGDGAVV